MAVVLKTECEGRLPNHSGKVRDIYDKGNYLLIVTTDRVSAYDSVMKQGIPHKGQVLHGLTKWWMQSLGIPTHFVSDDLNEIGSPWKDYPEMFGGRTMLVKKYTPLPIEAIVRGYLCGSAWKEYQKTGGVCGVDLPQRMQQNQCFFQPIFTPSTKAEQGAHDENITCHQMKVVLADWLATKLKDGAKAAQPMASDLAGIVHNKSISLFTKAAGLLWDKGIIMADTKLEWGLTVEEWGPERGSPRIVLIDECFTPDSSRFWGFEHYSLGGMVKSLDKQILRDWLDLNGWNHSPPPPDLPPELIHDISRNYLAIYERITGSPLEVEA